MSSCGTSKKILITIEGNIGGGKSTLLSLLKKEYPEFVIIDEPVSQWFAMKDSNGKSILEYFYEDKIRWGYTFQNCAFITRFCSAMEAFSKPVDKDTIFISERGVLTDRYVFAKMLKDTGCLSDIEWTLYTQWFDHFSKSIKQSGLVYVNTDANTCMDRIKIRARTGEENIPQDYLTELEKVHQEWITSIPEEECKVLCVSSDPSNIHKIASFALSFLSSSN
jgi:deoxyadenosine/deoxycytidine kinase